MESSSGGLAVVGNAHVRTQAAEVIHGAALSDAHIGGREHPDGAASLDEFLQRLPQQSKSVPIDEGTEQIDPIGGSQFSAQGLAEARVAGLVDEQCTLTKGDGWA